ncbi:hypothetical protein EDB84DRAFT_1555238 [Lactarius hengduanensis]|nr:hypothetical protein EDB84DRAFT_1555238 [Lactarius hengduanensis]
MTATSASIVNNQAASGGHTVTLASPRSVNWDYGRELQETSRLRSRTLPKTTCWALLDLYSPRLGIESETPPTGVRNVAWDPSLESFDLVVLVRVDNKTFMFLGYNDPQATISVVNLIDVVISPTQTMLIAEAGRVQINLTFLNPIEPEDWVKQSIPLSYVSLTAKSLDGAAHSTQVYSDLGAVWVSRNQSQEIYWTAELGDGGVIGHSVKRQSSALSTSLSDEVTNVTGWGTLYHFMEMGDNIKWMVAEDTDSRHSFLKIGAVDEGTYATTLPGFALSRDLGTIQVTQDPIVWVVGFATDPAINFKDLSGTPQQRSSFYKTKYSDDQSLVVDFMNDFANASSRARQLDQKILQDAAPISGLLGDLVSFATAHVYGSTQPTVAIDSSGEFNKSDVMAFMKNIDGRINPVETLYAAFPVFMYIDPDLGGLLLESLFRLQASPKYTNPYAAQDLDSGNMLIMTCAHARASGNSSLISRYYDLLTSWADYLSDSTLLIHDQYSADGLSTDNQTNLAIKGIIAIKAMSQLSSFVDKTTDFDKYSVDYILASLRSMEEPCTVGDEHLLGVYGNMSSWTLGYNLFADVWLNTSVVESSVYDGQSSFVYNLSLDPFFPYGMPSVDNLSSNTSTLTNVVRYDWSLFVTAMTPNQDLRTKLISMIYDTHPTFFAQHNIAQGAMYAPLALKFICTKLLSEATTYGFLRVPVKLTANPTTTETSSKSHTSVVARRTIRGVLSGVAAFLVIVAITMVVWRRRRQSHRRTSIGFSSFEGVMSQATQVTVTPFPTGSTLTEVAPPDVGHQTDSQQWLVRQSSSSEDPPLLLQSVVSVPVGLSSKELARLRSLANGLRSQPIDEGPSNSPLPATTDGDALGGAAPAATSSPEARLLRSEVNVLRDEIQRLHAEISESPPSYASGIA